VWHLYTITNWVTIVCLLYEKMLQQLASQVSSGFNSVQFTSQEMLLNQMFLPSAAVETFGLINNISRLVNCIARIKAMFTLFFAAWWCCYSSKHQSFHRCCMSQVYICDGGVRLKPSLLIVIDYCWIAKLSLLLKWFSGFYYSCVPAPTFASLLLYNTKAGAGARD